jgi:hypothetical protein
MADAIVTTATTLEGQFVEVALAMEALERAQSPVVNNLTIQTNTDQLITTITGRLPVTLAESGSVIAYTPTAYLP